MNKEFNLNIPLVELFKTPYIRQTSYICHLKKFTQPFIILKPVNPREYSPGYDIVKNFKLYTTGVKI
ncbi:MAG: hypothetical protein JSV88_33030 [Candidatus Aminicenantes bacterium]|nr:MAG: hypothetical protein JSV88_33030 [Candidatus Aminicenantes bacterium]